VNKDNRVSLSINIASISINGVHLWPSPSVGLCVYLPVALSIRKVYCGKMVDWIRMPFGMMSGVSRGMDVLDKGGDRRRGRTVLGVVNFRRRIVTNGTLLHSCARATRSSQMTGEDSLLL